MTNKKLYEYYSGDLRAKLKALEEGTVRRDGYGTFIPAWRIGDVVRHVSGVSGTLAEMATNQGELWKLRPRGSSRLLMVHARDLTREAPPGFCELASCLGPLYPGGYCECNVTRGMDQYRDIP